MTKIWFFSFFDDKNVSNSFKNVFCTQKWSCGPILRQIWDHEFFDLCTVKDNFQMGGASFCEGVAPIFDDISLSLSKLHHYT